MHVPQKINIILTDFSKQIKTAFGEKFCDMFLFGSYARGDFDNESDIDIAILANISRDDEAKYNAEIVKIMGNIYDIHGYSFVLSPIIINNISFNEWKEHLPFYKNVVSEGVRIVA